MCARVCTRAHVPACVCACVLHFTYEKTNVKNANHKSIKINEKIKYFKS